MGRGPHRTGQERVPAGGALVVSNHSGGISTPDVLIFASAFYDEFGYDRPVYTLAHDGVFMDPLDGKLHRAGVIKASRENAAAALHSDYDAYRPTLSANNIDFNGRTGYVRTAPEAAVPIVPTVSIGAQETQLFLTRGNWLARKLGLTRARMDILPVRLGFPFGLSVIFPPNLPLAAKVLTEVLEPIDVTAGFGDDPDVDEVDANVRAVMEAASPNYAVRHRVPPRWPARRPPPKRTGPARRRRDPSAPRWRARDVASARRHGRWRS
jgi:1-acyl-sn-glycerol-3-phosphate acyltransferase